MCLDIGGQFVFNLGHFDLFELQELDVGLLFHQEFDQEKAFDRVDHTYLLRTLEAIGFSKKLNYCHQMQWFC